MIVTLTMAVTSVLESLSSTFGTKNRKQSFGSPSNSLVLFVWSNLRIAHFRTWDWKFAFEGWSSDVRLDAENWDETAEGLEYHVNQEQLPIFTLERS
jgi:hypothetical protein